MANSQSIDEIVSPKAIQGLIDLEQRLLTADKAMATAIVNAKKYTEVLASAKGFGAVEKAAANAELYQQKVIKATAQAQAAEERLSAARQKAQDKIDAIEAKRAANEAKQVERDNEKLKRIEQIEARETERLQKQQLAEQQEISSSQLITAQQANEATARGLANREREVTADTAKQTALEIEQERQAIIANTRELRNNAREQNAAKGSLEQRRLALIRLRNTFDNLNEAERNSPFGQRLIRVIPQLNEQVLQLERSTGRAQRNVGNYGGAFGRIQQGAERAFGVLKNIANFLPGLGLAGLIGLLVDPIVDAISKMDIFKTKISETAEVTALASSEYKKATSDVTALGTSISEFQNGTISKKELVDRYNSSIGETVGKLQTATEVEDFYNKKSAAFVQATLLRAEAQAALNVATDKSSEALTKQIEGPGVVEYIKGIGLAIVEGKALNLESVKLNANLANLTGVGELKQEAREAGKLYDDLQKRADIYAKRNGLDFSKHTNGVDPAIQARKNAAALVQVQINTVKEQQSLYKEQLDNENFSLDTRLTAQQRFEERSIRISMLEAEKSKAEKKNSYEEILAIESKQQSDQNTIISEGFKQRNSIILFYSSQEEKQRIYENQKVITDIQKQRDDELANLILAYQNKGDYSLKAQEKLEADRLALINKYNIKEVYEQIAQAQKLIDIRKALGYDTAKEEAELSALNVRSKELEVNAYKKLGKEILNDEKERFLRLKDIGQELFNFSRSIVSGIYDKRVDALNKEADIISKNTEIQIDNVNNSTLSEQEKADKIAVIQANAANKQLQIEERVRQEKRRAAIADKAFAISQAIINGALAQTKVAAQTGVATFVFSPLVAALTAIQIASIIAQPIPKFEKGGTVKKDGIIMTGEKGHELRINPDGSKELTDNKANLSFAKAGTRIISNPETVRMMAKPDKIDYEGKSWDVAPLIAESKRSTKELKSTVKKLVSKNRHAENTANISKTQAWIKRNFS